MLEDKTDRPPPVGGKRIAAKPGEVHIANLQLAALWAVEAADERQQGALTGTRWAHQGEMATRWDIEVDCRQRRNRLGATSIHVRQAPDADGGSLRSRLLLGNGEC